LPHPFEDQHVAAAAPILTLPDAAGVIVDPVSGVPEPTDAALREAMVTALQDLEVPASTTLGNRSSFHMNATASETGSGAGSTTVEITWVLRSADGQEVGRDTERATLGTESWAKGTAPGLAALAKPAAGKLAGLIQEPPMEEHKPAKQVYVRPVEGAPGDGRTALPRALVFLLKKKGVDITPDAQAVDTIAIGGVVTVTQVPPDQEHVQIVWHVYEPDGTDFGQIAQENTIPKGTLDAHWGDVSMAIAASGVDDIIRVMQAIPPPK
jgi:hypothetical protein